MTNYDRIPIVMRPALELEDVFMFTVEERKRERYRYRDRHRDRHRDRQRDRQRDRRRDRRRDVYGRRSIA